MISFKKPELFKVQSAFRFSASGFRSTLIFALGAALHMTSCSRTGGAHPAITVDHEIAPDPARVGPATITLRLASADAKPVTGAHINLEADMSHPGMAPVFGDATEISSGLYQSHLTFGMAGDWVLLLHIALPDGQRVEQQFDVRNVRPN